MSFSKLELFMLRAINVDRFLPLQIDITNSCNLTCSHCYHSNHQNQGAMTLEQWKTVLDQYFELIIGMKFRPSIILCGGEPLISGHLWPLLEYKRNSDGLEGFFKLAAKERFNEMNFVRFVSEGFGRKLLERDEDQPLIGHDLRRSMTDIVRYMIKYKVKSHVQAPLFDLVAPGLGRSGRFDESIIVDFQGYILASSRAKLRLGHALKDGLQNVFLSNPIYRALRARQVEGCGTCRLYSVCGGDRNAAYAATGNFLAKDPGCWIDPENSTQLQRKAL